MRKTLTVFTLLATSLPCIGTDVETKTLTLSQAVKSAILHKPTIQAFQYAVEGYRKQQKAILSPYIPNISLTETIYDSRNSSAYKSAFGVNATQKLIDLSSMDSYKKAGKIAESGIHRTKQHQNTVRLATETAFYSAWLSQHKAPTMNYLFNSSLSTFAKAKHSENLERLNKNDWLIANVSYAGSLTSIKNYQEELNDAEKTLGYYTQMPLILGPMKKQKTITKLKWNPDRTFSLRPIKHYQKLARNHNESIKLKQTEVDTETYNSSYYAKQYLPTFSVFGNASRYDTYGGSSFTSKEAGVRLSWKVFDGLSNYFQKSASDKRKMKASLEKEDTLHLVRLNVRTAYSAFKQATANLETQKISYLQSHNEYILKKQLFKLGNISQVDFKNAEYSFELARFNWHAQSATTAIKESELLRACGYPESI